MIRQDQAEHCSNSSNNFCQPCISINFRPSMLGGGWTYHVESRMIKGKFKNVLTIELLGGWEQVCGPRLMFGLGHKMVINWY